MILDDLGGPRVVTGALHREAEGDWSAEGEVGCDGGGRIGVMWPHTEPQLEEAKSRFSPCLWGERLAEAGLQPRDPEFRLPAPRMVLWPQGKVGVETPG